MTVQQPSAGDTGAVTTSEAAAQAQPVPARPTGAARRLLAGAREAAVVVLAALVLSLLIKTFLVQAFWIPSASMQDTLVRGDRVLVSKLTPGPMALHRGDVVVFADPGGWLGGAAHTEASGQGASRSTLARALTWVGVLPNPSTGHLIKRVIGLPGDTVACCATDGAMTIDGAPVHEDYLAAGAIPSQVPFTVTVPAGHVWVEGDNRQDSRDSRFHQNLTGGGSVDEHLIVGRAMVRVWPFNRLGWLANHHEVFTNVPAPG